VFQAAGRGDAGAHAIEIDALSRPGDDASTRHSPACLLDCTIHQERDLVPRDRNGDAITLHHLGGDHGDVLAVSANSRPVSAQYDP
jgi:hypothetical protein